MYISRAARDFITRWGGNPDAEDNTGADLVTHLAALHEKARSGNLLSMASALRHGYAPDHDSSGGCMGALHEAVDTCHWAMADELLRHPIKRSHLLEALGTLLSHNEFYGCADKCTRKSHEYALRLMQRLEGLTQDECQRMLRQAFNGSALSFLLPLMHNGASMAPEEEWGEPSGWEWDCWIADEEEKDSFANRLRAFYRERLPRLLEQHRLHFPDFPVKDGKLYFTGNPSTKLPILSVRQQRNAMKDLERAALLFARF